MKILSQKISAKDGEGTVKVMAEDAEDMWHAYNLLSEGDWVKSSTVRKVVHSTATGSTSSTKKRITLTLEVETVDFDPETGVIRVKGRNKEENDFVKLGAYVPLRTERESRRVGGESGRGEWGREMGRARERERKSERESGGRAGARESRSDRDRIEIAGGESERAGSPCALCMYTAWNVCMCVCVRGTCVCAWDHHGPRTHVWPDYTLSADNTASLRRCIAHSSSPV